MQMDFGLLTLAYCPLLWSPSFLCSIVSIVVPSESCQLPNCDLFTSLALLSSFGRETSLVKITGPRSIFISLFTSLIYFSVAITIIIPCVLSFVNNKAGGIDNSSVLVGRKIICICVQVQVKIATSAPLFTLPPSCISASPTGDKPYPMNRGNLLLRYISPSTWGDQRGVREILAVSSQFLAPLPGTLVYKIGELHTIFYLYFLVLLVYLSVFTFVSLIKNTKITCYFASSYHYGWSYCLW